MPPHPVKLSARRGVKLESILETLATSTQASCTTHEEPGDEPQACSGRQIIYRTAL